jgi:hypothetical protein
MGRTYTGYDENGNVVTSQTAGNADDLLSPTQVGNAVASAQHTIREQIQNLVNRLSEISADAELALVVNTLRVNSAIDDFIDAIETLPTPLCNNLDSITEQATNANATLQDGLNNNAYNAVRNTAGVVSVR